MPNDPLLTNRIEKLLSKVPQIELKKMFGGVCFMHRGNMMCGVDGTRLMIRVGPEQYESALSCKYAKVMDITGKPMKGFIFVNEDGYKTDKALQEWLNLGLNFTQALPRKKKTAKKPRKDR